MAESSRTILPSLFRYMNKTSKAAPNHYSDNWASDRLGFSLGLRRPRSTFKNSPCFMLSLRDAEYAHLDVDFDIYMREAPEGEE